MPWASSPTATTTPAEQVDSALAGMINPWDVSVSSSTGSTSTNSSSGSIPRPMFWAPSKRETMSSESMGIG